MAPANRKMISIAALDKQATLSKAQKTFNRLIEQIDQRRTQMYGATSAPIDADLKVIYTCIAARISTTISRRGRSS